MSGVVFFTSEEELLAFVAEARTKILAGQLPFIDRLTDLLDLSEPSLP